MNIHIEHQKGPMGSFMLDVDGDCEQRNNRCSITSSQIIYIDSTDYAYPCTSTQVNSLIILQTYMHKSIKTYIEANSYKKVHEYIQ